MQTIRPRQIIDDALKTAEAKKRESLLEVKEESIQYKERAGQRDQVIAELRYSAYERRSPAEGREHR